MAIAAAVTFGTPRAANAQYSQMGAALSVAAIGVLGNDVAYDPVNDLYLMVGAHGPVFGACTNAVGAVTAPLFDIYNAAGVFAHYPRATYSQHVNGGAGGFLVTWHPGAGLGVHAAIVSCTGPTRVVSSVQAIGETASWWVAGAPAAYSAASQRFLVVWQVLGGGVRGRFVGTNGTPIGSEMLLANLGTARDPGVAWNPVTNEFGLSYSGWGDAAGAFAAFRKVSVDGSLSPLNKFGFTTGTFNTDITVNIHTGNFVVGWAGATAGGAGSSYAHFDRNGTALGSGLITNRLGGNDNFSLAFNRVSGTVLAVGQDNLSFDIAAIELNSGGFPSAPQALSRKVERCLGRSILASRAARPPRSGASRFRVVTRPSERSSSRRRQQAADRLRRRTPPPTTPTPTPTPTPVRLHRRHVPEPIRSSTLAVATVSTAAGSSRRRPRPRRRQRQRRRPRRRPAPAPNPLLSAMRRSPARVRVGMALGARPSGGRRCHDTDTARPDAATVEPPLGSGRPALATRRSRRWLRVRERWLAAAESSCG